MLEVQNLTHSFGDKILYKNASFDLYKGEHMGLVGQNGTGKSTLIKTLIGEVIPDDGSIKWLPKIKKGYLDQYAELDANLSIKEYLKTAFSELYEIDTQRREASEALEKHFDETLMKKAASCQAFLEKNEFYAIDSKIGRIAAGLGLTALGMERKLGTLSGGQRAKVILAKLLLQQPDVLLLDEPTNFLDSQHIEWLSKYLRSFAGAFVVVSHDFNFLERITTCICEIEFLKITKFSGNYAAYTKQKEQRRLEYVRNYQSQQELIARTENFIAKNKARAATASLAKSRQKKLDKIDRLSAPTLLQKPNFQFAYTPVSSAEVLEVKNMEIGYYYALLPKINYVLKNGKRVAVTGFNGIGKSTFLKTILGVVPALSGSAKFAEQMKVGYFEQDVKWEDDRITPLQFIGDLYTQLTQKEVRKKLAGCAIKAEHADQPINTLSGGEQAKVKLCALMLKPTNLLLLDEPTNHLDEEAKEAFQKALKTYHGSVMLVSHDIAFCQNWADEILDIEKMLIK